MAREAPPTDLNQLDEWLAAAEAAVPDLIPGAEKCIFWQRGPERAPWAIVYLHGFSATRQETAPLAERIARRLGANLFHTRLAGHGRAPEALARVRCDDWLKDAREALAIGRLIGERVVVIGNSTGATLATWLAREGDLAETDALVLMAPNFGLRTPLEALLHLPGRRRWVRWVVGERRCWQPRNEAHARYWSNCYPTEALLPMADLLRLVRRLDLGAIRAATLGICARDDRIINPRAAERRFRRIGARRKRWIWYDGSADPNQHILAGDILSPASTDELAALIADFAAGG